MSRHRSETSGAALYAALCAGDSPGGAAEVGRRRQLNRARGTSDAQALRAISISAQGKAAGVAPAGGHSGTLQKQGVGNRAWQQRWFVLSGQRLMWYENERATVPRRTVRVTGVSLSILEVGPNGQIIEVVGVDVGNSTNRFNLMMRSSRTSMSEQEGERYRLAASSSETAHEWLAALHKALGKEWQPPPPPRAAAQSMAVSGSPAAPATSNPPAMLRLPAMPPAVSAAPKAEVGSVAGSAAAAAADEDAEVASAVARALAATGVRDGEVAAATEEAAFKLTQAEAARAAARAAASGAADSRPPAPPTTTPTAGVAGDGMFIAGAGVMGGSGAAPPTGEAAQPSDTVSATVPPTAVPPLTAAPPEAPAVELRRNPMTGADNRMSLPAAAAAEAQTTPESPAPSPAPGTPASAAPAPSWELLAEEVAALEESAEGTRVMASLEAEVARLVATPLTGDDKANFETALLLCKQVGGCAAGERALPHCCKCPVSTP